MKDLEAEFGPPSQEECPECAAREETPKLRPGEYARSCELCGELLVFTLRLGETDLVWDELEEVDD